MQSDWILRLHANSLRHGNYCWSLGRMGCWLIVRSGYSVELICYCSLWVLRLDQRYKSRVQAWLFPRSETVLCGVAFMDPQMSLAKWPPGVWVSWIQQKQRAGVVQDVLHRQAHQCIFSTFGSICKVCSLKEEKYWEFEIWIKLAPLIWITSYARTFSHTDQQVFPSILRQSIAQLRHLYPHGRTVLK